MKMFAAGSLVAILALQPVGAEDLAELDGIAGPFEDAEAAEKATYQVQTREEVRHPRIPHELPPPEEWIQEFEILRVEADSVVIQRTDPQTGTQESPQVRTIALREYLEQAWLGTGPFTKVEVARGKKRIGGRAIEVVHIRTVAPVEHGGERTVDLEYSPAASVDGILTFVEETIHPDPDGTLVSRREVRRR